MPSQRFFELEQLCYKTKILGSESHFVRFGTHTAGHAFIALDGFSLKLFSLLHNVWYLSLL